MLDVRPARNAFVQILCNTYNVDVSAAIIILTLSTLHGRRVFDVHLFFHLFPFNVRSAEGGQVLARLWRVGRSMFDVHFFQPSAFLVTVQIASSSPPQNHQNYHQG